MNIINRIINRLKNKTIVEALKNQPGKIKRKKWEQISKSGKKYHLFKFKNLFHINLPIDSELSQYIFQDIFEKEEINFTYNILNKGDIFIDIGTNIGLYSLLASSKVGEHGRVISFEPTEETYKRLLENIALNNFHNITPIKKAISSSNGYLEINTSIDGFDAWNSFSKPVVGENFKKETVETITLDSFIEINKHFENSKLIKIDVEGWEKFVIMGGLNFLRKQNAPILLIEFEEAHTNNAGYKCNELYSLIKSLGYNLYKIKKGELILQEELEIFPSCNLVAKK